MKLFRCLLAVGVIGALLAGCGEENNSETRVVDTRPPESSRPPGLFSITLDGEPGPETAGLLTAYELDYLAEAGFEPRASTPIVPSRPVQYVAGSTDLGVTNQPQVVLAQEKGVPIVAVGSLVMQSTISMIWLKESKIEDLADLRGKTIAIPGVPYQEMFLEAVLARADLALADVKLERVAYDLVPALVSGRADAIFGGSWNVEGAALESRGLDPVVLRAPELGLPTYDELVVIARRDRVAEDPGLFRRFMAAVNRGTATAIENPRAATAAIYETSFGEVKRKPTEVGLKATLPLLSETGEIDPEQTSDLIAWMHEEGMIKRKLSVSSVVAGIE